MKNVILEARNISLEYRTRNGLFRTFKHKPLDNFSLKLYEGEILGITGGNGAGKSTLLRVLAGVLAPDAGEVIISQGKISLLLALGLGFNNELTGRDNAIIGCLFNGLSKKRALALIEEIKDFSELNDFFEQPVKTYSSGMRSRLGFAAAIMTKVDILMLDEVLSVGDKEFKEKAEKAMLNKVKESSSVIFVSHNEKRISKICDRVITLGNNIKLK
jgi:lipopolysaccharide transport system ATP-binding protein